MIPDQFVPYPQPVDPPESPTYPKTIGIATKDSFDPYRAKRDKTADYENPSPAWTRNPNYPLQLAVDKLQPTAHMHRRVTTLPVFGGDSVVTNIPFEERKSKVTEYWADYWLVTAEGTAKKPGSFNYLLYNQTVLMEMEISLDERKTYRRYVFPHVTSNVVTKVDGTPTEAREPAPTQLA